MIKIKDATLLEFYDEYMVAYNGVVYYCYFYPSDDFPDEKEMGVFVIQGNNGTEILCSQWEADAVWSLT